MRQLLLHGTMTVADRLPHSLCLLLGVLLEQGRVAHKYPGCLVRLRSLAK